MGSLNASVISRAAGHTVPSCAVDATNRAFAALRGEVFRLSLAIVAP